VRERRKRNAEGGREASPAKIYVYNYITIYIYKCRIILITVYTTMCIYIAVPRLPLPLPPSLTGHPLSLSIHLSMHLSFPLTHNTHETHTCTHMTQTHKHSTHREDGAHSTQHALTLALPQHNNNTHNATTTHTQHNATHTHKHHTHARTRARTHREDGAGSGDVDGLLRLDGDGLHTYIHMYIVLHNE
jgi:hypothetical protein